MAPVFQVLQEDIQLRKQNVDQALLNGLELLKRTTGELSSASSFHGRCALLSEYFGDGGTQSTLEFGASPRLGSGEHSEGRSGGLGAMISLFSHDLTEFLMKVLCITHITEHWSENRVAERN